MHASGTAEAPPIGRAEIALALSEPTVGASLDERLVGAARTTVVIPDRTRVAGISRLLPPILERIADRLPSTAPITLLSGGGTHAPDDLEEVVARVPAALRARAAVATHDATDGPAHVPVGATPYGTHVALDRHVVVGEPLVVVVGAIGFHYFAGFAGGRKGVFPGLGAYESVRANHRLVLDPDGEGLHPACRPGSLAGNPVHEDMLEAAALVPGEIFLVNAICDEHGNVLDVFTGDLVRAHAEGCRTYAASHTLELAEAVDVVLMDAGGHPRDIDLVQTHKSLVHAAPALRAGGRMVVLAECREGAGSRTFLPWFRHGNAGDMERAIRADYQLNAHTALSFRRLTERFAVFMVTDLDDELVASLGARPVATPEEAVALACDGLSPEASGLVLSTPTASIVSCRGG